MSWVPDKPTLVLGGAQLGMDYGVTNQSGKMSRDHIAAILQELVACPGAMVDVAPAYGDAEIMIGELAPATLAVCTKSASLEPGMSLTEAKRRLTEGLINSLQRMQRERLDIYLLHQTHVLQEPWFDELLIWLDDQKRSGALGAVGVSLYPETSLGQLSPYGAYLDWLQKPVNVLDQSVNDDAFQAFVGQYGIRVQARSVFLQGVLLTPDRARIVVPAHIQARLSVLAALAQAHQCSLQQLLIGFVRTQPIQQAVIGVANYTEWKLLRDCWCESTPVIFDGRDLACDGDPWLSPVNWQSL